MTDEPIQTPPESPSEPQAGVGVQLRQQRESLGLSIDDVVHQLKLTRGQVTAIEEDRFGDLPGNTFARGFVRNYARLLHLDPEPLVARLTTELPVEREQASLPHLTEEATFNVGSIGSGRGRPLQLALVVIAGLIIGAGGVFWYLQQPAEPELNVTTAILTLPEASAPVEVIASDAVVASDVASEVASAPVAAAVTPAPASAAASAVAVAGNGELRLVVEQDSWIQVIDAGGNKLISEVLKAGDERSLGGVAPYRIKIGNAPKTQLYLRGQRVDLAQYSRSDVATLELK
ncbi:helix-turn-helix domain-containing protein [Jeongeupia naejangsanensis]|uniref:Helix-turn-helix domain-containing protein n=1 Tax=Jeongeupia naejangsanensis TaxID=613195 RepID=A0ABS2BJ40_9NEIS|nr:helix-turn-helix domain-containing protein [Jeongeupia naejangsanensis]MBM3114844.1 helix-turn-helix domain-containing protein [Jeongeupia naejangsanensis]